MDNKKLERWASLLFDTGKRNNLVNFKDTKASTVEIVLPSVEDLFGKVESSAIFEVYDPQISELEDDVYADTRSTDEYQGEDEAELTQKKSNRQSYINLYSTRIKKNNQILLYNPNVNPINALKNIAKKAKGYIEETGVNAAYIVFGFLYWKENKNSKFVFRAPILLAPITFSNESAVSPWYIHMTEDDVVVNPTFSFKLNTEHGMSLPEYNDEGLELYFNKVEKMVSKLGWSVSRECKLGIFSFLKMNMYQDIISHQELILKNNNVRMLLGENVEIGNIISMEDGEHHLENPLLELHNVVDADSSQIEAIEMAKAGISFVLQGPPGTGKSQTITNIIAECINDGKKVLFVSEKQAALNVVYDKLRKAGLEEFCLELHSYKSNKKDVISDLCKTLRTAKTSVSSKADIAIESKSKSLHELDAYETELHKNRAVINKSLYQLYDAYSGTRKSPDVRITINGIEKKSDDDLRTYISLLEQYVDFIPSIGYQYRNNAWYGYTNQDTTYKTREEVKKSVEEVIGILQEYVLLQKVIEEKYGISCNTLKQTILWRNFFTLASESKILTPSFLKQTACSYLLEKMEKLETLGQSIIQLRNPIDSEYDVDIYKIDADTVHNLLTRKHTNWFARLFNSEYKQILSDIRLKKKDGKKIKYDTAVKLMEDLMIFHEKSSEFAIIEEPIKDALGTAYAGVDSDWNTIIKQIMQLKELFQSGLSFNKLEVFTNVDYEENKSEFLTIAKKIELLEDKSKEPLELLVKSFDKNIFDIENSEFSVVLEKFKLCLAEYEKLDNWCRFYKLLCQIENAELKDFIDTAINANIMAEEFVKAYERNFYRQWIDYIQHSSSVFNTFNRISHDRQVENFAMQDTTQFTISKVQIKSELSSHRPSLDFISSGSAVAILLREGEKKRKQKSIRALMEDVGELIQVIKPCFLMSPLSVSTFLDSESIQFDTVIFDEASQIFPQDAIGAIYRGKQLIVVGDSKQMPPSNFFSNNLDLDDSDEEAGDITDFESILDLCSTAFPQLRLRWHYRSRYEQLISFSNKNFYDNDLVTFPSAVTDKQWIGVDYYFAGGIFDHKSKNNE